MLHQEGTVDEAGAVTQVPVLSDDADGGLKGTTDICFSVNTIYMPLVENMLGIFQVELENLPKF